MTFINPAEQVLSFSGAAASWLGARTNNAPFFNVLYFILAYKFGLPLFQ